MKRRVTVHTSALVNVGVEIVLALSEEDIEAFGRGDLDAFDLLQNADIVDARQAWPGSAYPSAIKEAVSNDEYFWEDLEKDIEGYLNDD